MKKPVVSLLVLVSVFFLVSCASPASDSSPAFESMPASEYPPASESSPAIIPSPKSTPPVETTGQESPGRSGDSGKEAQTPDRFTASPANPDDIAHIFPMGLMTGAHVTPVDHQYYYWNELQVPLERYPVYSPADGYVINIQFLENDYIVFIEHSQYVQTEYIHLEKLTGPLAAFNGKVSWHKPLNVRVPVKAGEMIALDGGTNGFDFSVHDYSMQLTGFVNPDSYVAEPWKIHTADPYDYFVEPVLSWLLAKNVRQVKPLGGKIDFDIPGRLIGNWFVEGTNGYAGLRQPSGPIKPDQQVGYWNTHLAIAPDPIDPTAIIVSTGWFDGQTAQLAVMDIAPHPEEVSAETGLVKYELVDWQYVYGANNQPWTGINRKMQSDIRVKVYPHIRGVVIFSLLDDDHLKAEFFPGKTAEEVSSFTANARVYVR